MSVREFEIVAGGDILPHDLVVSRARELGRGTYDFRPMFARIRPLVDGAALAICHLEVPIGLGAASGYPVFNAPDELADAIAWTGWDVCTTASNHAADQGRAGIESTLRSLDRVAVAHTGSFRTRDDSRRILIANAESVKVAVLAYTYGLNVVRESVPAWSVNLISRRRIEADAARARRLGADLVIANLHWGEEYVHAPSDEQRELARDLLGPGAVDLILGQHAHVVQPIEEIDGRFVVFGMGTLLARLSERRIGCQDGLLAVIRVRSGDGHARVTRVDYVPTCVRPPTFVIEPAAGTVTASFERTVRVAGRGPRVHPQPALQRSLEIGEPRQDGLEVAARLAVGNVVQQIFIRASEGPVATAGEAFLAPALLPAMVLGADVRVAGPISPRLVAALPKIQELFHGWASWYQLVRVEVESRRTPARSADARVGCFFSGGLDSLYTVLKRHHEISELIFVHGFDVPLENTDLRARVVQRLRKAAAELGKPLLEVETNLRSFSDAHVDWGWAHLAGQAAVAYVLAPRFSKILIPSTHPDVYYSNGSPASGSHPVLPALWSSNEVELTHDGGEVGRVAKAAAIAEHDIALETLRVCWWNPDGAYNCGRCEKCLTTMINLYAVGALDRCETFPRQLTLRAVASLTLPSDSARFFMAENLRALEKSRRDPELAEVIRLCLERGARVEA